MAVGQYVSGFSGTKILLLYEVQDSCYGVKHNPSAFANLHQISREIRGRNPV
jgi:hypothetical protein